MTESASTAQSAAAAPAHLPAGFSVVADDSDLGPVVMAKLAQVETRLHSAIAQSDPLADAASRHLAEAGGKRVRPLLTILASHLGDPERDEVIECAAVVELTHLATLYHDDVMDSAKVRRGAPAAHEVWGNSVAILTGDLLFARASSMVSAIDGRALGIQARTFERLCLGQLHETVGPGEDQDAVEHYLSVIRDKTGSLVAASGQYGALYSGAPEEYVSVMAEYGEKVGVAFQLADDVIDLRGAKAKSGKTPGTDLREGVPTLPVLLLRRYASDGDESAARLLDLIDGDLDDDAKLQAAVSSVAAHPATEEAWQVARAWADDAISALEPLPEGTLKRALKTFADAVVAREG